MDRDLSNHCTIMMENKTSDFGPRPFRVFDVWLEDKDCEGIVLTAWNKEVFSTKPDAIFRDKLKNVKHDLRKWGNSNFGKYERDLKAHKDEAKMWELTAENRSLSDDETVKWKAARCDWAQKEDWKTQMLHQKSRVKWVTEGNENSSFFRRSFRRKGGRGVMI